MSILLRTTSKTTFESCLPSSVFLRLLPWDPPRLEPCSCPSFFLSFFPSLFLPSSFSPVRLVLPQSPDCSHDVASPSEFVLELDDEGGEFTESRSPSNQSFYTPHTSVQTTMGLDVRDVRQSCFILQKQDEMLKCNQQGTK